MGYLESVERSIERGQEIDPTVEAVRDAPVDQQLTRQLAILEIDPHGDVRVPSPGGSWYAGVLAGRHRFRR
jgi:hypothetical protein